MELRIGVAGHRGKIERFRLDLLEVPLGSGAPKTKALRTLASSRKDLAFSLKLDAGFWEAKWDEILRERIARAAEALAARWVVAPSDPRFSPTQRNRKKVEERAAALAELGLRLAWEPRGLWSDEEMSEMVESTELSIVRDLSRVDPIARPLDALYTRVLGLGTGGRLGHTALQNLVRRAGRAPSAFVIVPGEGALGTRKRLLELATMPLDPFDGEDGFDEVFEFGSDDEE